MADDIGVLRAVRDEYLLSTPLGTLFVDTYYRVSPPIADVVAQSPMLAAVVRFVLVPIIVLTDLFMTHPLAFALVVAMTLMMSGVALFRRKSEAEYR